MKQQIKIYFSLTVTDVDATAKDHLQLKSIYLVLKNEVEQLRKVRRPIEDYEGRKIHEGSISSTFYEQLLRQ